MQMAGPRQASDYAAVFSLCLGTHTERLGNGNCCRLRATLFPTSKFRLHVYGPWRTTVAVKG
jgi:hypothetical protein